MFNHETQRVGIRPATAGGSLRLLAVALAFAAVPRSALPQVLRVGGFDFNARAKSELTYTTNVQRERPGATTEEPEDYFVLVGLDLTSVRPVGRSTTLDLATGVSYEKHFIRDDLDNSSNPFGHFFLQSHTEAGRIVISAHAGYDRLSQSSADRFSPEGLGKARDPRTEIRYGIGASYQAARLAAGVDYRYKEEDHDEEQFAERNQEELSTDAYVAYRLHDRITPAYRYDKKDTKFPDNPGSDLVQVNHRYIVPFLIIERNPRLEYAFTWQKEDRGDGLAPEWKPRHTLGLNDSRDLSPSLGFDYYAMYDNYPQPAEDQIQFTYGVSVRHKISRTASHSAGISRQPVDTFGTTTKSDQTRYEYRFSKSDLFIYDLTLQLNWQKQETIQHLEDGSEADPEETITTDLRLVHARNIHSRLRRTLEYTYTHENSSSQPDDLIEHRFSLKYDYQF